MRHLIQTLGTTLLLQAANLGSGVLAARLLEPVGRGELEVARLWPTTIAYVVLCGLQDAVVFRAAGGRDAPRDLFAAASALAAALAAIGVAAGAALLPFAMADQRAETLEAGLVLLAIIPCHLVSLAHMELLRGQMRLGAWNLLRLAQGVSYPLLALAAWALGHATVAGFVWAFLLSHLPAALIPGAIALREGWAGLRPRLGVMAALLRYGLRAHAGAVIAMLNAQADKLLLALWTPPAALGLYVVAVTLAQATYTLANSVALVAWPRAAAAEGAERAAVVGQALRLALALMLAATAGLLILGEWALTLLFGAAFAEAADLLRLLALGSVPMVAREFFALALKAADKPLWVGRGEAATLAVNAALLAALTPSYGALGAAIAYGLTRLAGALYLGRLAGRALGVSGWSLLVPRRADLAAARAALRRLKRRPG